MPDQNPIYIDDSLESTHQLLVDPFQPLGELVVKLDTQPCRQH